MYQVGNRYNTIDELLNTLDDYQLVNKKIYNAVTRRMNTVQYVNLPAAFDIETSSFYSNGEKRACMYIWQLGINGNCVTGRTWEEFYNAIEKINTYFGLDYDTCILPIYVHNLAYEFQFLKDRIEWTNIFAREKRQVIKANTKSGFEFRCSYALTGCSLAVVGNNLTKYPVKKMVGDLDYDKVRNSMTPITDKEMGYCCNDVFVVMSKIQEDIETYGDVTKIPMTNTGRVRNYCQGKCLNDKKYSKFIKKLTISGNFEYDILKRAFQGGFTHASIIKSGKVYNNVASKDFTSSYPTVMIAEQFPMSSGVQCNPSIDEIEKGVFCYVFNLKLNNVRSKIDYEHYLSESKCFNKENVKSDNGRIISADTLTMTITEVDWDTIKKCYDFDSFEIGCAYKYVKGYLPKLFVDCILYFYNGKTTLKGVKGKEAEYQLLKGMLNSTYGMTVTDIINDVISYDGEWESEEGDVEKQIDRYNNGRKRFLFYPWGVYVTAYARHNLWEGILECGNDYIYSDTDSIKILNEKEHMSFIDDYNERISEKLKRACNYQGISYDMCKPKTIDGEEKPMGIWDDDGHYTRFKTLGAKRYLTQKGDELVCTIAGVNKKRTSEFLKSQSNPFEFFENNMTVDKEHSGRLISTYIDNPICGTVTDYLGNTCNYEELSAIHMEKSEYNLTMTPLYLALINAVENPII